MVDKYLVKFSNKMWRRRYCVFTFHASGRSVINCFCFDCKNSAISNYFRSYINRRFN